MAFTLEDMKKKVYSLIEDANVNGTTWATDYTADPDFKLKFNDVANEILFECFNIRKKVQVEEITAVKDEEFDLTEEFSRFYLLKKITGVKYTRIDNMVTWLEDGEAKVYYYTYPKPIERDTGDDYVYRDLDRDVIECMSFGIAGDILKSDPSNDYGQIYYNRYLEKRQNLDNRYSQGTITIGKGVDI